MRGRKESPQDECEGRQLKAEVTEKAEGPFLWLGYTFREIYLSHLLD